MNHFITHIRKLGLLTLAVTAMLSTISCQSSKKIMEEESLTGIYEIRSSGLFNKSYTFANYTINDIKSSGKPSKSVLRHEGASKSTSTLGVSFAMEDENGFKWSGLGAVEAVSVSLGKNKPTSNTLTYTFRITESQTGRVLRYEIAYKPASEGFDGFMKGTVVDESGNGLYEVYSSKNLDYTTTPSDGINGFSIRKNDEILCSIIKTKGDWSVIYNVGEDDPERVEISAVLSSLFVLIEEGKI
jgi:hypothetical protein